MTHPIPHGPLRSASHALIGASIVLAVAFLAAFQAVPEKATAPHALIDGTGEGWRVLGEKDFVNVNCHEDTWDWSDDGVKCSGQPVGVTRSIKPYVNFELVCEWRHMRNAGNSGIFLWSPIESMNRLEGPGLPEGIEVQVLDLGYKDAYEQGDRKADWFTCHGDVFPVGGSTMKPFLPAAPNGRRSFPSENRSKGIEEWNHYYIRAINGEVRLWVNGKEVSGGKDCSPRSGYLALESEGSPVEFRNLRIRELP